MCAKKRKWFHGRESLQQSDRLAAVDRDGRLDDRGLQENKLKSLCEDLMAGLMAYVYWLCFGCGYNRLLSTDEKKKILCSRESRGQLTDNLIDLKERSRSRRHKQTYFQDGRRLFYAQPVVERLAG